MAKKIELNKQTLRVLSAEEMEAVAGGVVATEMPITPSGCHTRDGDTITIATTTDTSLTAEMPITPSGCHTRDGTA